MKYIIFFIGLLLLIPFVSSQPPVTQVSSGDSLEIAYPKYTYSKLNEDFKLHFHVFNVSTIITNTTATCNLHLYNPMGGHILKEEADFEGYDFEVYINKSNFSMPGYFAYIIWCNTSKQTGFASGVFIANHDGFEPLTPGEGIIYGTGVLVILIVSLFFFILGSRTKGPLSIILIGTSFIFIIITSLFVMVSLNATTTPLSSITDGFSTYWFVMKILISMLITGLVVYVLIISYVLWMDRRGLR
jgi:hypothetical protein